MLSPALQPEFDFLILYGPRKQSFTTIEVAEILGVSDEFVRLLISGGELHAHLHGLGEDKKTDAGKTIAARKTARVTRESLRLYLAKTANYDDQARIDLVVNVLSVFTPAMRAAAIARAQKQQSQTK